MADESRTMGGTLVMVFGIGTTIVGLNGLLGALIFLFIGGIFSAVFPLVFGMPMEDMRLNSEAWTCPGELVAVDNNTSLEVNGQPTVKLRYEFEVGGRSLDDEILVTASDPMATWAPGTPLTVEYLSDDPTVSRIQGGKANIAGWAGALGLGFGGLGLLATLATLVVVVFGIALILLGVRKRRRARVAS